MRARYYTTVNGDSTRVQFILSQELKAAMQMGVVSLR